MVLKDYNFVRYDPKQIEHIERHLEGSCTTGSHFTRGAFSSARDLVDYACEHIQDYAGEKIVREVDVGRDIGYDALVLLRDVDPGFNSVSRESRGGNDFSVSVVRGFPHLPKKKTRQMVVVAGPLGNTDKHGFYTIFPGTNTPSFPLTREKLVEIGYSGAKLEKQVELNKSYREFWDRYGFIGD